MPNDGGVVREIAWREIFPWLLLFRSFRISIQLWQLLLSSAGVLLTIFGWWVLAKVFGGTNEEPLKAWLDAPFYQSCPWSERDAGWPWKSQGPWADIDPVQLVPQQTLDPARHPVWQPAPPQLGRYPANPFYGPWRQLRAPFRQLFERKLGITGLAFLLCCCLWAAAVWALFGGAITRRAAIDLGREENVSLTASLRYAAGKWSSYFAAPLLPLVGLFICACPVLVLGLLMRFNAGLFLAGIVWPLALLAALVMALLLMALLFGWPLMWPTISTEGTDSFDALSRSWSYVYHRPLHYLFYAAVVTVLGALGWLLVAYFADWVAYLPAWAASWTAGNERMDDVFAASDSLGTMGRWGAKLIFFWSGCVRLLALGFVYSYFWTASTAIYFLLRRDDDGTDLDDVHLEASYQKYGLPPLEKDTAGVPVVPNDEQLPATATAPAEPVTETSPSGPVTGEETPI
ncbi:MAG TPA: hypothetical protein VFI31_05350 [Pirellulales bacterium]|nr:hypothetical protein [Pirellulales bacterium]